VTCLNCCIDQYEQINSHARDFPHAFDNLLPYCFKPAYMDSIDIIDICNGDSILPGEGLRDEILDSLTGNAGIHSVCEEGRPIIQWNKSLPTGQLLPSGDIVF
jgi:hypothetical protein